MVAELRAERRLAQPWGRSPGPSAGRGRAGRASPSSGPERCWDASVAERQLGKHGGAAWKAGAWRGVCSGRCAPEPGGEEGGERGAACGAGCAGCGAEGGVGCMGCGAEGWAGWAGGSSQGEVRSAVRNAQACDARGAVRCGARRDLGTRGTRPLVGVAAGVGRRHGGFSAGCPGTISVGGCVSRDRAPLAGLR